MQLVVVMAVRKAVAAATITFTAISIKRFFIIVNYQLSLQRHTLKERIVNSKESPRRALF